MGDFFANLGRSIENAAKDVERALNEDIKPWFKQAGRDIDHAINHDVIPWFDQAGRDIGASFTNDILPWLEQAGKDVEKVFTNDIVPWFEQAGKDVEKFAADTTQELGKLAAGIDLDHLPDHVVKFVEENPVHMALFVLNVLLLVAPALTTAPLLGALGFTAAGPAAGSVAAGWQSAITPAAAHGLFATLQSAAMGGYGAGVVGGIVRAGALGSSVIAGLTLGGSEGDTGVQGEKEAGILKTGEHGWKAIGEEEVLGVDEALRILWENLSEPSAEDDANSSSS